MARSPSPEDLPPPPRTHRSSKHSGRHRGYSLPEGRPRSEKRQITLTLCVFHSTRHVWKTAPVTFDPRKINDRELWWEIRETFRSDVQKSWRRFFGFKKVMSIVPIAFTPNGVPVKADPRDHPEAQSYMHAYHNPNRIRPEHDWVDFFVQFDRGDQRQNGLEFVEGLWADKLAVVALVATAAIIITCIVWCVLGGQLQTVFTVMSFVLTLIAAQIALAALYYQVATPNA